MSDSLLILGGASTLAHHTARLFAAEGASLTLVGRDAEALERIAADLTARGAASVRCAGHDLESVDEAAFASWSEEAGGFDAILVAYGLLGDQDAAEQELAAQQRILSINFTSAAGWMNVASRHLLERGGGTLAIFGSVAGDRARKPNYVYGAAKAGLHAYADGMGLKLAERGVRVVVVKPGQTRTAMTRHLDTEGPLWANPGTVAKDTWRAMRRGQPERYSPWHWRWIMRAIRAIPRFLFKHLSI